MKPKAAHKKISEGSLAVWGSILFAVSSSLCSVLVVGLIFFILSLLIV